MATRDAQPVGGQGDKEGNVSSSSSSSSSATQVLPLWFYLENVAEQWLYSLYSLYRQMQVEQQALYLEMGYSAAERMRLAGMFEEHLETIGISLYSDAGAQGLLLSPDEVRKLLPSGLLQTLFYELLCKAPWGTVLDTLTAKLAGHAPFARHHRKDYEALYGRLTDDAFRDTRRRPARGKEALGDVSAVSAADGAAGNRVALPRARRAAGRVGEHYRRPVSEP